MEVALVVILENSKMLKVFAKIAIKNAMVVLLFRNVRPVAKQV